MKREKIAALFMLFLLALSLWNIHALRQWSQDVEFALSQCQESVSMQDFALAQSHWNKAFSLWERKQAHLGVVLAHPIIDSAYDAFYDLNELLQQEDDGASAACERLSYHLKTICQMEQLRLGSIF